MLKALHVLDHFAPISSGYTFRSRSILENQRKVLGVTPVVVTSPRQGPTPHEEEDLDGVRVYRTRTLRAQAALSILDSLRDMKRLRDRLLEVARKEKPDVIHAHSPVLNAWPAIAVGRQLSLPVVYEIRAFWEDAAVLHGTTHAGSLRYRATRLLETQACRRADVVVTICEGLREALLERRIAREKIFVLPNGVDVDRFEPLAPSRDLQEQMGLQGKQVIGFIGSLYRYEGLHHLVDAMSKLAPRYPDLRCLIVGGGFEREEAELREQAERLSIADRVLVTGRVPHAEVNRYYSIIDVLVYPRVRSRLLELVTPLKILEALAMEKAVVGSDVGGIREIIRDGAEGLLFRADDADDLARVLASLLDQPRDMRRLGVNGRRHMQENRSWDRLIENHRAAYRHLGLPL